MTKEEIEELKGLAASMGLYDDKKPCKRAVILGKAIEALEQEPSRDMEEIAEVMNCDADAETKCKMISDILTAKPHYFKKQEPNIGHWEWLTEDKYRCSNCNHETRVDECMNEPMYDFCPFCSAKMESEG